MRIFVEISVVLLLRSFCNRKIRREDFENEFFNKRIVRR